MTRAAMKRLAARAGAQKSAPSPGAEGTSHAAAWLPICRAHVRGPRWRVRAMTDVTIEPATSADLESVAALLGACRLPYDDLGPEQMPDFVLARAGHRIVATGGLERYGAVALLRSLAVAPDFRGGRLGERIWSVLRAAAIDRGVTRLFLLTTTAEPLFQRWGFHRVAREDIPEAVRTTKEFVALCPSTAVAMTIGLRR